jgi:hypothetical protein
LAKSEAETAVVVQDLVMDRNGRPRWAVIAVFVDVHGSEPRCIDYRVRVVPEKPSNFAAVRAGHVVLRELEKDTRGERPADFVAAELSAPTEGIPRRVFEVASQARLLAKARTSVKRRPDRYTAGTRQMLKDAPRRIGRPPVRDIQEKLRLLAAVENAYATGVPLATVAKEHTISRASLRDLVAWARHDARPQLFTTFGPGRRGGELTPAARAMLEGEI